MLAFACPRCGILVQVPEHAAGKKVRCGGCHEVVDAPEPAAALTASLVPSGPSSPAADPLTLPPADRARPDSREQYDFLAPPQADGELGRLGPYRVLRLLGSGGMGVVFQAEDTQLRRPVALKALLPVLAATAAARERFLREARAAAAVNHDHVVTIYQVGEDRGVPYLAMALLQGETLEARLRREKTLPLAEVLRIGREVAEGLAAAHDRGLIHRDVKPANVWLEIPPHPQPLSPEGRGEKNRPPSPLRGEGLGVRGGRVKLLDFGLALAAGTDARLTQSGALIGTPGYLAPEQTRGGPPDPRTDLFGLGCVLYRMCTGALPFQGRDALAALAALATETPRPVRERNPEVPPALSALVMRLLAKDPAGRPPSARAVVEAIVAIETGGVAETPGTAPLSEAGEPDVLVAEAPTQLLVPGRRVRPGCVVAAVAVAAAGFAALVLLVTGVVLLAWNRQTTPQSPAPDLKEPFAAVQAGIRQLKFTERDAKGGAFGRDHYQDVLPDGGLLIGFEVGIGKFTVNDVIDYVRPIYLTADGEKMGKGIGKPTGRMLIVKAKPGYAVGAIHLRATAVLDGFSMTFMPIGRTGLKREGSYESEWIGAPRGDNEEVLDGEGAFVVGICGRSWEAGKPTTVGPVLYRPEPD